MPRVGLDLWELEFRVAGVHAVDLVPSRSAQHFNDLDELVHSGLPGEEWLADEKLCNDTAR